MPRLHSRTLRPLIGVRAIAEAAGLDPGQVLAMVHSGHGNQLGSLVAGRQLERGRPARRVDWDELIESTMEIS